MQHSLNYMRVAVIFVAVALAGIILGGGADQGAGMIWLGFVGKGSGWRAGRRAYGCSASGSLASIYSASFSYPAATPSIVARASGLVIRSATSLVSAARASHSSA